MGDLYVDRFEVNRTTANTLAGEKFTFEATIRNINPGPYVWTTFDVLITNKSTNETYLVGDPIYPEWSSYLYYGPFYQYPGLSPSGGTIVFNWDGTHPSTNEFYIASYANGTFMTSMEGHPYHVPPGKYLVEVFARAAYSNRSAIQDNTKYHSHSEIISLEIVVGPAPRTTLIEFPTALPFSDDEGNQVEHHDVYFKAETDGVEDSEVHHPIVLSLDGAIDGGEEQGQGQQRNPTIDEVAAFPFTASWEFDAPPLEEETYEWRLRDPDGESLTEVETITVPPGTLIQPLSAMLRLEPVVQQIEFLKLDYRVAGEDEWQTEALPLDQPIFVTLDNYIFSWPSGSPPPTEGILDIATYLATGASDNIEAKALITQRMVSEFWQEKEFHFNPDLSFATFTPPEHRLAKAVRFHYGEFMVAYNDPEMIWEGDSVAMSCLMAACCEALGVADIFLIRYTGEVIEPTNPFGYYEYLTGERGQFYGPFKTLGIKSAAFKDESGQTPTYKVYDALELHQVISNLDNPTPKVWDVAFWVGSDVVVKNFSETTYRIQYLMANTFDFTVHERIPLTEIDQ